MHPARTQYQVVQDPRPGMYPQPRPAAADAIAPPAPPAPPPRLPPPPAAAAPPRHCPRTLRRRAGWRRSVVAHGVGEARGRFKVSETHVIIR